MVDKERSCTIKNILMKPLLRLLSCQRQMTLAIQTGKRFPGKSPPCRCKLYNILLWNFID